MKHILINWHDASQRVIIITFLNHWTIEEMHQARHESWQMLDAVNHRVTVVMDFSSSPLLPQNPLSIIRQADSMKQHPNKMLPMVAVCPQRFFRHFLQIVKHVHPAFFKTVIITETISEALALVTEARSLSVTSASAAKPEQPVL